MFRPSKRITRSHPLQCGEAIRTSPLSPVAFPGSLSSAHLSDPVSIRLLRNVGDHFDCRVRVSVGSSCRKAWPKVFPEMANRIHIRFQDRNACVTYRGRTNFPVLPHLPALEPDRYLLPFGNHRSQHARSCDSPGLSDDMAAIDPSPAVVVLSKGFLKLLLAGSPPIGIFLAGRPIPALFLEAQSYYPLWVLKDISSPLVPILYGHQLS